MIATVSQWAAIGVGAWLIGVGLFMLVAPSRSLRALAAMGGADAVHYGEMALRIAAGVALVLAAAGSRVPHVISPIGWFLIASALVILTVPRRWHAAYSTWWAARIPVVAVRCIAPLSWIAGGALIWSMV